MYMTAEEALSQLTSDMELGLELHLKHNHDPPLPVELVPACHMAILLCEVGLGGDLIELPACIEHEAYGRSAPAREIVEGFHLDFFFCEMEE
jgi:hypothetical protein